MKLLPLVVLLFLFACVEDKKERSVVIVSKEQIEAAAKDSNKVACNKPDIYSLLVRSDTAKGADGNYKPLIKWYDQAGRLRLVDIHDFYKSDTRDMITVEKFYDTVGHLIYEGVSKGLVQFQCHQYQYDEKGHLVVKSGYSAGNKGSTTTYVYEGDKLVREMEESGGKPTIKKY